METPKLLEDLLKSPGPSGYEAPAARIWRDAAGFAELTTDGLGSTMATIGPEDGSPLVAVVGHIDEIGLVITHIDDQGFLYFAPIGGWDPQILVGQRVKVISGDREVAGVAGRKPIHLLEPDQRKQVVKLKEMHIDIGAADRESAEGLVAIGDPVVIDAEPLPVADGRLVAKSMDNRIGAYVALEALRRCHEDGDLKARFAAVASVQEEIGLFGSRTSGFQLRPDLAVVIEVTHATDAPGIDEKEVGSHKLGSGPVIGRGSTLSPKVYELLVEAAETAGIDFTVQASGNATHTDADALQSTRSGVPTGLISVPLRYMHSPVEMVDLGDLEDTVRLVAELVESLRPGIDLSR